MPKKYKRHCDHCGRYYESQNDKYCSRECYHEVPVSAETRAKLSAICKAREIPNLKGDFRGENHPLYGKRREASPLWKGGRKVTGGYVKIYLPDHPCADTNGYYLEHRHIAEQILGRILDQAEVIHHINGDKQDNKPENLYLFASNSDHFWFHENRRKGDATELTSNLLAVAV